MPARNYSEEQERQLEATKREEQECWLGHAGAGFVATALNSCHSF